MGGDKGAIGCVRRAGQTTSHGRPVSELILRTIDSQSATYSWKVATKTLVGEILIDCEKQSRAQTSLFLEKEACRLLIASLESLPLFASVNTQYSLNFDVSLATATHFANMFDNKNRSTSRGNKSLKKTFSKVIPLC
jgi:hypothetical protein